MNKYTNRVLKYLASPKKSRSREALHDLFCPGIVEECLADLISREFIKHADFEYDVEDNFKPYKFDGYYVTLKGLDAIENSKKESFKYWIPIALSSAMSVVALVVSILK